MKSSTQKMNSPDVLKCGLVAVMGRPNVGKSTLVNRIVGFKLSSTSRRPQTTRHRILGVKSTDTCQTIYVDTPGFHQRQGASALFRSLNRTAATALNEVDVIVFVCDGLKWTDEDEQVINLLKTAEQPVLCVVNKIDKLADKERLLPYLDELSKKMTFQQIIPLSATKGKNVDQLESCLENFLPEVEEFYYPKEQKSLQSHRFYAAEMVREKVMRHLGDELPYSTTVEIESFEVTDTLVKVAAIIWVEREGQKGIVIGKNGDRLKEIGTQARLDMETRFDQKVFLKMWVKVRSGWADDERALRSFGYID